MWFTLITCLRNNSNMLGANSVWCTLVKVKNLKVYGFI